MLTNMQNLIVINNIWLKTNTILPFFNGCTVLFHPVRRAIDLLQMDKFLNKKRNQQIADCA
ncbi:hypothetical protein EV200_104320 [Pedobacter psychrotolerans]|uniref:Uncharacterized protein n=2 Tax=Pedobacter psychrotolerans TaxID=1843235 RepID=A0A4R2HE97_9SPHI|nr:hypothetical protein EV200_104320 [Pedobacter psychrotolerans]GGE46736.1 hypothetical protein GCM10011413_11010 [Pedobacter psychrotolerans]